LRILIAFSPHLCGLSFMKKIFALILLLFYSANFVWGQNAPEIVVTLDEKFLNAFLGAVFDNLDTPKFQLAKKTQKQNAASRAECDESIVLLREANGVKTAVRFDEGKIVTPLAFVGKYDFPFVGCSDFSGWAEANLNLEYDQAKQVLFGRVKVNKVDFNGVPSMASGLAARLVQNSVDKKINPIEILKTEQVSATVPVRYANGSIKLRAVAMKPEILGNALNVRVAFEFAKAQ
jgi:hypothetical protein